MLKSKKCLFIAALAILFVGTLFVEVPGQMRGTAKRTEAFTQPESPQARILLENFVYSPGQLTTVSGGSWVNISGTGNFIQVTNGSLSYANYPASGSGNKVNIVASTASSQDVYRQFATQTTGTVYAAFLVNVTDTAGLAAATSSSGDYFAGFLPSTSTSTYRCNIAIKTGSVADTIVFGVRPHSTTDASATFDGIDRPVATTYLIVLSYTFDPVNPDVCRMWVNPPTGPSEPISGPNVTVATTDIASIARFALRQDSDTPNAAIDGLQVGTSWADVANTVYTASGASVSGRVTTADGRGITNARVTISGDSMPEALIVVTGRGGAYSFEVEAGGTYVVMVGSRRFTFAEPSQIVTVNDNVAGINFKAN
jgi:hypothetical protein